MRPGPPGGAARARVRSGVAPAPLLDVQTPAGEVFYWSDRALQGIAPAIAAPVVGPIVYQPWLMSTGALRYNKTLQTDTASVTLQNLSGDVLQTDFERIARRSVLEGSLFVFRYYAVDLEWAWLELHGTLTVGDAGRTVQLNLQQLLAGSDDTPDQSLSETCQLTWAAKRCGATGNTECFYTYASCQVVEHFTGIQTAFEVNNPAAAAALPAQTYNRKRAW